MSKTILQAGMPNLSASESDILRLTEEPYLYVKEPEVHQLLTTNANEYLDYIDQAIHDIESGRASIKLPSKQILTDDNERGDFRVMPCVYSRGNEITKIVKLVGTNLQQFVVKDQITVGKAFVIDPLENFISHIFEACLLSSARTGACATMALRWLAPEARKLNIIGSGRVGFYAALYAAGSGAIESICLSDTDQERAYKTAKFLTEKFPDLDITTAPHDSLPPADVLVLATTSKKTLSDPDQHPVDLVISLGADSDNQHELSSAWIGQADIFVDTYDSTKYGDLQCWLREGLIKLEQVTDFFDLLKQGRTYNKNKKRLFVSTGSALFDNISIAYMLKKITTDS